jgi:phosphoribosylglycinamide formyltransferase 1
MVVHNSPPYLSIAILGSTKGTTLQPIIDTIELQNLAARIELVVSNKCDAPILHRAKKHGIPTACVKRHGKSRLEYDTEIIARLSACPSQIDLILLIGWMRILSPLFIQAFKGRIVNVHPSLLPKFAGGMDVDVHQAVLDAGETESGCTLHLVDEGVDTGKILIQKKYTIKPNETPDSLKKNVQALEGQAFVELLSKPGHYLDILFPIS